MKGYIYKITIDNKHYYGSCRNIKNRVQGHINRSKDEKYKHLKIYSDFSIFNFNVIETIDCIDDYELKKKEQEYIESNDTINNGLNTNRAYLNDENDKADRRIAQKKYISNNLEKCLSKVREINKKHRELGTFRCYVCDYNFCSNRDLKRHFSSKKHLSNINER